MLRRLRFALVLAGLVAVSAALWQWATWPDVAAICQEGAVESAFIARHRAASEGTTAHNWVPYAAISDHLKHAVIVAEDIDFFSHDGFATEEMKIAIREALEEGKGLRGASTISQQTAKNLWLTPSRNPWRKVKEALLTVQLEGRCDKRRILEIYLNVAQFGPDTFGAEAAARDFYGRSAAHLSRAQAAELAAGLSRPRTWNPRSASESYRRRVDTIRRRMALAEWVRRDL